MDEMEHVIIGENGKEGFVERPPHLMALAPEACRILSHQRFLGVVAVVVLENI